MASKPNLSVSADCTSGDKVIETHAMTHSKDWPRSANMYPTNPYEPAP